MNSNIDEIKSRVNDLITNDTGFLIETLDDILIDIKNLENEEEKNELINYTAEKVIEEIKTWDLDKREAKEHIKVIKTSLKNAGLSRSEIKDLFQKYDFNVDAILSDEYEEENDQKITEEQTVEEDKEIVKIEQRIAELTAQLDGKTIEELEKEKSEKTKELNEQIKELEEQLPQHFETNTIDVGRYDTENLEKMLNNRIEEQQKFLNLDNEIEQIETELKRRENEKDINRKYEKFTTEDLTTALENLKKSIENLTPEEADKKASKEQAVKEIEEELNRRQTQNLESGKIDVNRYDTENLKRMLESKKEEKNKLEQQKSLSEIEQEIKEIKEELEKRQSKYANYTTEQLTSLLGHYKNEISKLTPEEVDKKTKIEQNIAEIEKELNRRKNKKTSTNNSDLEKRLEELKQQQKEIQSEYDKKINIHKDLENLKEIRDAYNKIKAEAIAKIGQDNIDDEVLLDSVINEFINNHESTKELYKYENAEKLKKELHEEVFNNLKVKKVDKKEQNKKIFYKALAGVAGFATGLVASAVPGVGTIRMGIAGAKLAASAVNMWTKKHPEGKIAKIKDNFKEKHPKITNAIKTMKEKIKSDPLKWAINGFAAGYITGNMIEMVTGESLWEHLKGDSKPTPPDSVVIDDTEPVPPLPDPIDIELEVGKVYDISMLDKGYISSYSGKAVSIIEEIGKNVEVDKFNIVNGEKWVHFKQLNGKGYAWFKVKDVQEALAKVAEQASSKTL